MKQLMEAELMFDNPEAPTAPSPSSANSVSRSSSSSTRSMNTRGSFSLRPFGSGSQAPTRAVMTSSPRMGYLAGRFGGDVEEAGLQFPPSNCFH